MKILYSAVTTRVPAEATFYLAN